MVVSFIFFYLKFLNENFIMRNVKMFIYYKLSLEVFIYENCNCRGWCDGFLVWIDVEIRW